MRKKMFFDKSFDVSRLNSQSAIAIWNKRILIMIFLIIFNVQKSPKISYSEITQLLKLALICENPLFLRDKKILNFSHMI